MNTKKLSQWVIILIITMLLLDGCSEKAPARPTETATLIPPTATDTPLPPTATDTPLPPTATDTPLPPTTPVAAWVFENALQKNGFSLYPENQKNCIAPCKSFQNFDNYNMGADIYENGAFNLAWTFGFGVDPIMQTDIVEKIISAIYPQDVASGIMSAIKANSSSIGRAGNYNWNLNVIPSVMITIYIAPNP